MYTCSNWELVKQFQAATSDLEDIAWSPDAACLAAWDNCLTYNLTVCTPGGETLAKYSAYSNALGIKTMEWSPSGQMLVIGSFDQVGSASDLHADAQCLMALHKVLGRENSWWFCFCL